MKRALLPTLALLAAAAAPTRAEVVHLKDGRVLQGEIAWIEGGAKLRIAARYGAVIVSKADVVSIDPDPVKPKLPGAGTRVWVPKRAKVWITLRDGWKVVEDDWPHLESRRLGISLYVIRGPHPLTKGFPRKLNEVIGLRKADLERDGAAVSSTGTTTLGGRPAGELIYRKETVTTRELLVRDRMALITIWIRTRAKTVPALELLKGVGFGRPPRGAERITTQETKPRAPAPKKPEPVEAASGGQRVALGPWEVRFPARPQVEDKTRDGHPVRTVSVTHDGATFRAVFTEDPRARIDRATLRALIDLTVDRMAKRVGPGVEHRLVSREDVDRDGATIVRAELESTQRGVKRTWVVLAATTGTRLFTLGWFSRFDHPGPFDARARAAFFSSLRPSKARRAPAQANRFTVGPWSIQFPTTPKPEERRLQGVWRTQRSASSKGIEYCITTMTLPKSMDAKRLATVREDATRALWAAFSKEAHIRSKPVSERRVVQAGLEFLRSERKAHRAGSRAERTWVVWTAVDGERRFVQVSVLVFLTGDEPATFDRRAAEAFFSSLRPAKR